MNQPRRPGAPPNAPADGYQDGGQTKKGSIKAAREALQAMMESGEGVRREPNPGPPPPIPPMSSQRGQFQGSASAAQAPSSPQWPLTTDMREGTPANTAPKAPAPQRPPRPSYVPSILDPTKPRDFIEYSDDDDYSRQRPPPSNRRPPQQVPRASVQTASTQDPHRTYWEDDFTSPTSASPYLSSNSSRPLTTSSQSTTSSLGTIPDFPSAPAIPVMSQQSPTMQPAPRRSPALGPPPSARRGPLSYYSQNSYVSPIVEESETTKSRSSYASSTAIPSSTAQDFYIDEGSESQSDVDGPYTGDERKQVKIGNSGAQAGLVRQASLGKRGRPALTTIKSGDNLRSDRDLLPSQLSPNLTPKESRFPKPRNAGYSTAATLGAVAGGLSSPSSGKRQVQGMLSPSQAGTASVTPTSDPLSTGTGLIEGSSSASDEERGYPSDREFDAQDRGRPDSSTEPNWADEKMPVDQRSVDSRDEPVSPVSPVDPRVARILGGLERGGALDPAARDKLAPPKPQGNLGDRVGARRPPRLNVDAVKEAESRGSLSSLPELIRRATRLASNLERGKTASRLGLDFWELGNGEKGRNTPPAGRDRRSGNSLSDMLSAFPPPGLATPPPGSARSPNNPFRSPSNLNISQLAEEPEETPSQQRRKRRRCCGMPLWVFILIMIALVLLVAAAIIVPVALIVLPRQSNDGKPQQGSIQECQQQMPCQNGGTNVISGTCRCLCVNGFTGNVCQMQSSDPGCTSSNVPGAASNATIGSSIPRLIQDSAANFSIPLDSQQIFPLFTEANFSCTSENALVTFDGVSQKRSLDADRDQAQLLQSFSTPELFLTTTPTLSLQIAHPSLVPRQVMTSNGIIMDGGTPTSTLDVSVDSATRKSLSTAPAPEPEMSSSQSSVSFASISTAATSATSGATASSSATVSSSAAASAPSQSIMQDFARVAVLFVLQNTMHLDAATTASDNLASFFNGNAAEQTQAQNNVSLGNGYSTNLRKGIVALPNGLRIGGKL